MVDDFGTLPKPPRWALDAGLPAPRDEETFAPYVLRLGFDPKDLLVDLTEQTAPLANYRLATTLQRCMPEVFDSHIGDLAVIHIGPERRMEIENAARSLFGDSYRTPSYSAGSFTSK